MDETCFATQLSKLAKNFGLKIDGEYYENKAELLWEEFKNVPNLVWERTCRQILETEEHFPTIARIKSVLQEVSRFFLPEREIPKVNCPKCEGTGYVSTCKKNGDWEEMSYWTSYVFRCTCEAGAYREKEIPVWDDKWRNKKHVLRKEWDDIFEKEQENLKLEEVPF